MVDFQQRLPRNTKAQRLQFGGGMPSGLVSAVWVPPSYSKSIKIPSKAYQKPIKLPSNSHQNPSNPSSSYAKHGHLKVLTKSLDLLTQLVEVFIREVTHDALEMHRTAAAKVVLGWPLPHYMGFTMVYHTQD